MQAYTLFQPLLFALDPEQAHTIALESLNRFKCFFKKEYPARPVQIMGLNFPNPVGLAAGLDKSGDYIDGLAALGFGFIEVGTVTPLPQLGNPKPRMFRLPEQRALINRMGFNNKGVDHLVERVRATPFKGILGINISKNATTPLEKAHEDYLICLRKVYSLASYIVINISSPNTAQLRHLQFGQALNDLLGILKTEQKQLWQSTQKYTPLVIKISPDLRDEEIKQIAYSLLEHQMDGVIATNTTLSKEKEQGGLSGKPLSELALSVTQKLAKHLQNKIPIIASGGIMTPEDASRRLEAGASLVQVYTGLIYQGPGLVGEILKEVVRSS